MKPMNIFSL